MYSTVQPERHDTSQQLTSNLTDSYVLAINLMCFLSYILYHFQRLFLRNLANVFVFL